VQSVNRAFKQAAQETLRNIIQYTEEPLVSSDIIGNPYSCVFDASWTRVVGESFIKVFGWYDNEFGYSSRTADILKRMADH
jgi:glyceraldehyde 3-phosphate dehydrogenase